MSKPDLGLPERTFPHAPVGCRCVSLVVFLIAVGGLVALSVGVFLYLQWQDQARACFEPPIVLVTAPIGGATAPAGSYLSVSATAFGTKPIVRTELWVDGELKENETSGRSDGEATFYADFYLLTPSEGPHMLFVRAVNAVGAIGQSTPVSIISMPKPSPDEVFLAVRVGAGKTLADIAKTYGTAPATLQKLNPDLDGEEPAADSVITVPIPPEGEAPAPNPPPPAAPGTSPVTTPNVPPLPVNEPAPLGVDPTLVTGFLAAQPPAAPSGLQAQVTDCKIKLVWNDNANNEARHDVWVAGLGSAPRVIAALKPAAGGPTWFEFPAPQPGYSSFWVEAVNFFGGQPSNIAWVSVDPQCPSALPAELQLEALDMTIGGGYDRAYCYVSFESAPETRIPGNGNQFINVQGGQGDISSWAAGNNKFVVPIPPDGALEIGGECWGWSGKTLNKLGAFSGRFATEAWDGSRRPLEGGGFQIGFAIKPLGAMDTREIYGERSTGLPSSSSDPSTWIPEYTGYTEDPTLPAPYDLSDEAVNNPALGKGVQRLLWGWDGDQKKITGFVLFQNSLPLIPYPHPEMRGMLAWLPGLCGNYIRWQVAAVNGSARSKLSNAVEHDQAPCPAYAVVKFEEFTLDCAHDGPDSCLGEYVLRWSDTTLEAYYEISVNGISKRFGQPPYDSVGIVGPFYAEMDAHHTYSFSYLASRIAHNYPDPDTIKVPIDPNASTWELKIRTRFWDWDEATSDDEFGPFSYKSVWANTLPALLSRCTPKGAVDYYTDAPHWFKNDTAIGRVTYSIRFLDQNGSDICSK